MARSNKAVRLIDNLFLSLLFLGPVGAVVFVLVKFFQGPPAIRTSGEPLTMKEVEQGFQTFMHGVGSVITVMFVFFAAWGLWLWRR